MAAAQVQAMVSMAEALHRIAAALEGQGDSEGGTPAGAFPARPSRTARQRAGSPEKHAPARPR
jgi:hypothetical protein